MQVNFQPIVINWSELNQIRFCLGYNSITESQHRVSSLKPLSPHGCWLQDFPVMKNGQIKMWSSQMYLSTVTTANWITHTLRCSAILLSIAPSSLFPSFIHSTSYHYTGWLPHMEPAHASTSAAELTELPGLWSQPTTNSNWPILMLQRAQSQQERVDLAAEAHPVGHHHLVSCVRRSGGMGRTNALWQR